MPDLELLVFQEDEWNMSTFKHHAKAKGIELDIVK